VGVVAQTENTHKTSLSLSLSSHRDPLLQQGIVHGRVQAQLLPAARRLEAEHDVRDGRAIPPSRSTGRRRDFFRRDLGHLPFVHLFRLLDAQADGAPKVFRQDFRLFHLRRIDLRDEARVGGRVWGWNEGFSRVGSSFFFFFPFSYL